MNEEKKHISFSAINQWNKCPYSYKIVYVDKVKEFNHSEFTAFGSSMHYVIENLLLNEKFDKHNEFKKKFEQEIMCLKKCDEKLINTLREQSVLLLEEAVPAIKNRFGDFEVISTEKRIEYSLNEQMNFLGYIDLIIKIGDEYKIIDWKTTSWGWDARKKSDKLTGYQLAFYKYFLLEELKIDPKKVETYFILLKRTAKKDRIEFVKITSGQKKINNALELMNKALFSLQNNFYVKNKLNCDKCDFKKTKYCS
ncbi:PD-(D/E)XK nuclease family protein [Candidatus Pacearchaeota archaeon]|nr:PD-(D/E)XK nuclease family protein [Candidatus Pacearchaeota archaeon]